MVWMIEYTDTTHQTETARPVTYIRLGRWTKLINDVVAIFIVECCVVNVQLHLQATTTATVAIIDSLESIGGFEIGTITIKATITTTTITAVQIWMMQIWNNTTSQWQCRQL